MLLSVDMEDIPDKDSGYAAYVLALALAVNLFNYIDRQALYAVFPLIKADLSLTDTQLGVLASSFMIVYMLFAPLAGYFGDRYSRPGGMGLSAVVWSLATMSAGCALSYPQLVAARSAVGIGEAGYGTMAPSYVSEWFFPGKRARVLALFSMAIPAGSAVGYMLGGHLGQSYGWRTAFLAVGLPGALLGAAVFFLKEPRRLCGAGQSATAGQYLTLFRNRAYILTSLAQAAATFSLGGLAAWMPTYFVRRFGFGVGRAGLVFGGITVLAGIAGTLAGGWTADRLLKRTDKAYFAVSCAGFILSVPFAIACVLAGNVRLAAGFLFLAEFFVFSHSGPLNAAIVKVTPAGIRSMAFALNIFIIHALGDAVSPAVIGIISDRMGLGSAVFFCALALIPAAFFSAAAGYAHADDTGKTL